MPYATMKTGFKLAGLYVLISGAIVSLFAADIDTAIRTTEGAAERWGLWAVLALAMVAASMYGLWKQTMKIQDKDEFIQGRLIHLVEEQVAISRQVRDALRNAPCGKGIPDSDNINEATPTKLAIIERQKARKDKREG